MIKSLKALFPFVIVIAFLLTGCQASPEKGVVISKRDSANIGRNENSQILSDENQNSDTVKHIQSSRSLCTTDGTIDILFNLDEDINYALLPIYTVMPHYITAGEAKEVANLLFPDGTFFEARPYLNRVLSKEEIQNRIARWSQYTNKDALQKLYGRAEDKDIESINEFIQSLTIQMENAESGQVAVPCKWDFQKSILYDYTADQVDSRTLEKENDEIRSEVVVGDLQYEFSATTRDQSDFKLNNIFAYLNFGLSPMDIDNRIFTAELCRTEKPTEQQLRTVRETAKKLIDLLPFGQWEIDECTTQLSIYGDKEEYKVCVRAVPSFEGVAALRCQQLRNLKSTDVYASTYYLSDISMEFSVDGQLLDFKLFSPIDIGEISTEHIMIPVEELLDQAATFLALRSAPESDLQVIHGEICVNNIEYGLVRTKVPESDDSYYYVPAIVLKGKSSFYVEDTKELYSESDDNAVLLCLNATNGTVIDLWQ